MGEKGHFGRCEDCKNVVRLNTTQASFLIDGAMTATCNRKDCGGNIELINDPPNSWDAHLADRD